MKIINSMKFKCVHKMMTKIRKKQTVVNVKRDKLPLLNMHK